MWTLPLCNLATWSTSGLSRMDDESKQKTYHSSISISDLGIFILLNSGWEIFFSGPEKKINYKQVVNEKCTSDLFPSNLTISSLPIIIASAFLGRQSRDSCQYLPARGLPRLSSSHPGKIATLHRHASFLITISLASPLNSDVNGPFLSIPGVQSRTYRAEEWYVVLLGATLAVGHPFGVLPRDEPPPSASPLRARACVHVRGCAYGSRVSLSVRGTLVDARSRRGGHARFRVDGMFSSLPTSSRPLRLVENDGDADVGGPNRRRAPTITHCW